MKSLHILFNKEMTQIDLLYTLDERVHALLESIYFACIQKIVFSYAHEVQIGSDEKRFLMFGYTKVETDSSSTTYPFEN